MVTFESIIRTLKSTREREREGEGERALKSLLIKFSILNWKFVYKLGVQFKDSIKFN